ncbi:MAG: AMP-binding protein, partial [Bdellovibrionales bacterium]|nr:AMP-binding protein [Bdellovibrionales bacterium]
MVHHQRMAMFVDGITLWQILQAKSERYATDPFVLASIEEEDGGMTTLRADTVTWNHLLSLISEMRRFGKDLMTRSGQAVSIAGDPLFTFCADVAFLSLGARVEVLDAALFNGLDTFGEVVILPEHCERLRGEFERILPSGDYRESSLFTCNEEQYRVFVREPSGQERGEGRFGTFSSGTTGTPRRLTFSLSQLSSAIEAICSRFPEIRPGKRTVSYLPCSALYQRIMNFVALMSGVTTVCLEDPREIFQVTPLVHPHYLIGVPLVFSKFASLLQDVRSVSAVLGDAYE